MVRARGSGEPPSEVEVLSIPSDARCCCDRTPTSPPTAAVVHRSSGTSLDLADPIEPYLFLETTVSGEVLPKRDSAEPTGEVCDWTGAMTAATVPGVAMGFSLCWKRASGSAGASSEGRLPL